jgi:hypothetical protein
MSIEKTKLDQLKLIWFSRGVSLNTEEIGWLFAEIERLQEELSLEKQLEVYNRGWRDAIKAMREKLTMKGEKG